MKLVKTFFSELSYFWSSTLDNWAEWAATFCLAACSGLIALSIEPKQRAIFANYSERYPYTGETITTPVVGVLIIIIPCFVIGVIVLAFPRRVDLSLAGMSLAQTLCLTLLVTEALKVTVARPRPNFFSYCGYDPESAKCTASKSYKRDAKLSFPSGHASNSFASGTWMCLFLCTLWPRHVEIWWVLVKLLPVFVAIAISATRITDYMHHVSDVVAGAVLGIGMAMTVFYSQYTRIFMVQKKKQEEEELLGLENVEDDDEEI